jgi:hypothetical protein
MIFGALNKLFSAVKGSDSGGGGGGDPLFDNVTYLVKFDEGTIPTNELSSSGDPLTNNGVTTSTAQSKFGTHSAYFSSGTQTLSSPYSKVRHDWYDDKFTLEAWVYFPTFTDQSISVSPSVTVPAFFIHSLTTTTKLYWSFGPDESGDLCLFWDSVGGRDNNLGTGSTGSVPLNQWVHIAFVYDPVLNYGRNFINGVQFAGGYMDIGGSSNNIATSNEAGILSFGINASWTANKTLYVDSVRMTKGVDRYFASPEDTSVQSFTPPTEAFLTGSGGSGGGGAVVVITPTSTFNDVAGLFPFDGTDGDQTTTDESNDVVSVTFNGYIEISSDQSKFGGTSVGNTFGNLPFSYLSMSSSNLNLGALFETYTFETWIYINVLSGSTETATTAYGFPIFKTNANTSTLNYCQLYVDTSGVLTLERKDLSGATTSINSGATTLSEGEWYHIALTQQGGGSSCTNELFIDGVSVASGSFTSNMGSTGGLNLGLATLPSPIGNIGMNGYQDDVRVVKDFVLYEDNFIPPTFSHSLTSLDREEPTLYLEFSSTGFSHASIP